MSNLNDDFSADFETHLRELKYIPIFKEFSKYDKFSYYFRLKKNLFPLAK